MPPKKKKKTVIDLPWHGLETGLKGKQTIRERTTTKRFDAENEPEPPRPQMIRRPPQKKRKKTKTVENEPQLTPQNQKLLSDFCDWAEDHIDDHLKYVENNPAPPIHEVLHKLIKLWGNTVPQWMLSANATLTMLKALPHEPTSQSQQILAQMPEVTDFLIPVTYTTGFTPVTARMLEISMRFGKYRLVSPFLMSFFDEYRQLEDIDLSALVKYLLLHPNHCELLDHHLSSLLQPPKAPPLDSTDESCQKYEQFLDDLEQRLDSIEEYQEQLAKFKVSLIERRYLGCKKQLESGKAAGFTVGVGPSKISGAGLGARIYGVADKGAGLGKYTGVLRHRHLHSQYAVGVGGTDVVDAAVAPCLLSLMNTIKGKDGAENGLRLNAKFGKFGPEGVHVRTINKVINEELLVSYGRGFRIDKSLQLLKIRPPADNVDQFLSCASPTPSSPQVPKGASPRSTRGRKLAKIKV
eukprot:TRINITY_DN61622_c0_g1_i1.p1 TRINITY_DN61622_c0_g1~~TRINITY_DN61622_c0_g1_i1.p1  ORF type:complete len:477 (+),score=34.18 TRINITY_DN61622_c0_g1_i1:34-1431(+)